jgi:site-specific DNA-cytosine methylase
MKSTEQAVRALASMLHNYRNLIQSVDSMLANPQAIFDLQNNSIYTGKIDNDFTTWTNGEKLYNYSHIYRRPDDLGRSFIYEVMHFGTPNAIENYNQLTQDQGRWEIISPVWRNHIPSDYYSSTIGDYLSQSDAQKYGPSVPDDYLTRADQSTVDNDVMFQTNEPDQPGEAAQNQPRTPRPYTRKKYFVARVPTDARFKTYYAEHARIEHQFYNDPKKMKTELNKLNRAYADILADVMPKLLDALDKAARQKRPSLKSRDLSFTSERKGYTLRRWENQDFTNLSGRSDLAGTGNAKEVHSILANIAGNNYLVNVQTVSNSKQLASVLREQYKFDADAATGVSEIVDRFARAWALEKVKSQIGRSLDTVEVTGQLARNKEAGIRPFTINSEDLLFKRSAREEPEILKATAEYMREFYRERFAAFGVIDQAHDFDQKYKGAIFRGAKKDNLAFNIIVGFASRDQSTGIHEIAHALLRSMSNDMRKAIITNMMKHNRRAQLNTTDNGNVKLPVDIEEMWATAFESSLMLKRYPVRYDAHNPNAKGAPDPTLVKVWNEVGEYLRGCVDIVHEQMESDGRFVDPRKAAYQVQWYAPLKDDQKMFKNMGVVVNTTNGMKHAVVNKAQANIDDPISVIFEDGTSALINRIDIVRLGGWSTGFNDSTLDTISQWLGSYYADAGGRVGHRQKMETSFPELFADYDANTIQRGQINASATEAARFQEVDANDVHDAVSSIVPMSIAEYLKLVKDGIMPPTRDGRYLEIDKKIAIARANVALSMAIDNKPNWEAALQYVPTLGTSAESIEPFTKTPWVSKRELVLLAKQLNPSLDENQLWQTYQKLSSHGVKNVTRVFFDKKGSGPQLVVPASEAPTLAAIVQMRQDGLSMSFASKVFASKIDKSVTEQYITPDEFDNISMQVMGVKYSDRDQRRIFNDLNIIPHLVRDARTNNYAFLPQHITILKAVAEARKQQVAEFEKTPLISGQTYKTGPSWAKIKDRLVNNGDYVDAYNYIVNHPQYISKGRELTLEPLTQHGNKKYFHGNSYTNVEPTGLFQTNEQPHPNTKIASLSSDNQIRTALSTIVGQGRVQFSNGKINSVSDRNGNPSNVYRMLTNNHGYDDRTALGLYAMTETAGFKKWSGSHPILEAVVNDDVRPDISIDKLTPNERISVRKYLSGKAILAVMADTSALSDSDVDTLAVQLQDYYREKNLSIDDITKQLDELLDGNNTDRLVAFMAAIESELRSSRYDNVRQHMRSADSYRDASSIIRTGKPFVSVAMSPKNSAGYLKHLGGYVLPSGVTSMDGDSLTAKYVRMDNPQVKDLKGQGITFPQVEAMLENAVKAKRDGLVLLNVNHTVGGMSVLHNIVIPRNSHKLRSIDVHPKISLASYFSGAGTLEVGAKSFAIPALAVEYDNKIARIYEQNHGNHVLNADVLTIDPETLKGVQWFHASPVCTDVSNAKTVGRVKGVDRSTDRDRDFARAVANVITTARPPIVTIENTEAYAKTSALKIITDALDGYTYDIGVYNSKDYGSPTDRKRMFVRAMLMPSNGVLPPVPSKLPTTVSWMDAIQDILPKLPIDPTPGSNTRMTESLRRAGMDWNNVPYPVLVQATQHWIPRPPDKPAPTIVASDGQSFRVVMPGGLVYKLNKDAIRRLQGLPDDFILPDTHKFAQKIIGNGIPPQLTNALVSPLVKNHLDGQMQRIADGYADSHEPALFQTAYDPVDPQSRYRYTETHNVPGAPYYVERITPRSAPTSQGRLWNVLDQINDISRLVLSGDLAFATLQGGILGLSTPRVGIKAFYAGLHGFAPNLQVEIGGQKYGYGKIGREVFHQIGDGLRANPMYEIAREAGLPLSMYEIDDRVKARKEEMLHNLRQTNPSATMDDIQIDMMTIDELGANDEWYMKGRFTQHLPMQGQFERFNVIMHDVLLLTQFDNWNKVLLSKGYEPGTEKYKSAMRDAARILSVAIGDIKYSTDTQKDATASRFAKVLFTAPRWLMSRALIDPFINPIISNSALFSKLREVMGEDNPAFHLYAGNKDVSMLGQSLWLRLAGVQLAMIIMALIYQNWNPDVEVDVTRNFGRVRVGDFRIDPAAGQFDHWKLAIRMTTALLGTDSTAVKKAQRERLPYWLYQIKDVSKELQYKMSPMLNTAISLLGGNDYQGFYENPFGSVMTGRSLSVVGNGYFSKSDTAQAFYDSVLKPGVADIFGQQAADNVSVSNAIVERLPTLFPQMFDALQRAMDYDRPVAAYVAANTIPNWLGFKVEVAPSEELKTRVRRKNQVTPQESPTLIKMLAEGRLREIVSGTDKPPVKPWGSEWGMK